MSLHDDSEPGGRPCTAHRLSSSELGSVEVCFECGMVRLNVQALSLRLNPEAFQALALMVGEAHVRLRHHADRVVAERAESPAANGKPH